MIEIDGGRLRAAFHDAVDKSGAPGAVLYVGDRESTYFHEAYGLRQRVPESRPVQPDTLYDLASLTKVIATTTAVMMLRDQGLIRLDQSIADVVPVPAFRAITLHQLLTHTSGLNPGKPYYKWATSLEEMFLAYADGGIDSVPGRRRYSDVGFMLLGKMVELVSAEPLDRFCHKHIFEPLGMKHTAFTPPVAWRENCAATEKCEWRGRVMLGEVHDENSFAVGGVSGQAGLFSTAEDLAIFARALLNGALLPASTLDEMSAMTHIPTYPWQGLGWQMDPWESGLQGYLPSRVAIGHTGWTGTSIWIDRASGLFSILLGNTCHPSRNRRDNRTFRQPVHREIARMAFPTATAAHSGLDRVVWKNYEPVLGQRFALLTNHAAVDLLGRPIRDVLELWGDVRLHTLYSPEHGLRGQAEAGQHVSNQRSDVPLISLFGERKAPTQEELSEVSLFIVDLQDVGSRYYTYMATMKRCMEACAKAQVPMLILDRPNPLGGLVLEGPIATQVGSDVCCAPIPARHGMTMGELAQFFVNTEFRGAKLHVEISALDNWHPEFYFEECSLPWVPPSPNLPTPRIALLYAGMCLFEGVNLNEGRGTDEPFGKIGAPWLDPERVLQALEPFARIGLTLEAVDYTPQSIPGKASAPRFRDEVCHGIRVVVEDPHLARPFATATALLSAIGKVHGEQLVFADFFDTLAGGPQLRQALRSGASAASLIEGFDAQNRLFDGKRPKFYTDSTR